MQKRIITFCFRYSACIRQAIDHCCVEFRVCPVMDAFSLDSSNNAVESTCMIPGAEDMDYVVIAGEWADTSQLLSKCNYFLGLEHVSIFRPKVAC